MMVSVLSAFAAKQVKMYGKREGPDSIIKGIAKDRLRMDKGDGSDLELVFRRQNWSERMIEINFSRPLAGFLFVEKVSF